MIAAVEPRVERAVFEPAELDLLGTYAGARFPFPLRVPSVGRIEAERTALLGAAARTLRERGLANEHGPVGVAAELVDSLQQHRGTVDLVVVDGAMVTGIVAMLGGQHALVCHQAIGDLRGKFTVTRVGEAAEAALTDEFTRWVPKTDAAPIMPITLPPGVVGDTLRLLECTAGTAAPAKRVRTLIRERGGDAAAVDALVDLLPSVVGRGQLGGVRRQGNRAERPLELSWLDSPRGRVRVDHDARGWVSINPLRHDEFVRALGESVSAARN